HVDDLGVRQSQPDEPGVKPVGIVLVDEPRLVTRAIITGTFDVPFAEPCELVICHGCDPMRVARVTITAQPFMTAREDRQFAARVYFGMLTENTLEERGS